MTYEYLSAGPILSLWSWSMGKVNELQAKKEAIRTQLQLEQDEEKKKKLLAQIADIEKEINVLMSEAENVAGKRETWDTATWIAAGGGVLIGLFTLFS